MNDKDIIISYQLWLLYPYSKSSVCLSLPYGSSVPLSSRVLRVLASPLRYGLVHSVHSSPTGWRNVGNRRDDRPTRREGERWEQRPRSRRSEPRGGRFISPSVRFTFLCLSTGSAASCLTHSVPLPLAAQPNPRVPFGPRSGPPGGACGA